MSQYKETYQRITIPGKGRSCISGAFQEICIQAGFFKNSKGNARFELESAVLVHFR